MLSFFKYLKHEYPPEHFHGNMINSRSKMTIRRLLFRSHIQQSR